MKKLPEGILWRERKRTFLGLPWSFTIYSCSEEILYIKRGFFNQSEDEVRLYRIMDLSLKKTFGQRMFKVGTIHCCSSDKTMKDFDIINIKHVDAIKKQLSELVEKQRVAKRVTSREYMVDSHEDDDDDFESDDNHTLD